MVYIVVGVLLVMFAPLVYRRRQDPKTQQGAANGAVAATGLGSGKPYTPGRVVVSAVAGGLVGVALIVYGITQL